MNWDEAYDNRAHVGNAEEILAGWSHDAADYRSRMLSSGHCDGSALLSDRCHTVLAGR